MRKLCDKDCGNCELGKCLLKYPPYDWVPSERTRTNKSRQQRREYMRRKREICIAFGVCRECMCRTAANGNYCLECYVKIRNRSEAKRNGIHRAERTSFGLCYFCGEPAEKGFKTCAKHHFVAANNLSGTDYQDNKSHPWRKQDRLVFLEKKGVKVD